MNRKCVIFRLFRRRIVRSNVRLLTGFSSFLSMSVNRGNEARVYGQKSSHCFSKMSLGNPDRPNYTFGSPDIKVGRSPGRSDQELCDLGRNRLIHGFFWDLPEQYFLASVDGRLRRPRSGWGACSAAAKSRRKVFNLWLLLDDRWAGDTAQVEPVR